MRFVVFTLLLLLAFSGSLYPQALSGTIVGTVTDQAGAVVPNARVTLLNEGTQFTRAAVTNASGQYVAYSIPTGSYTLTVEQPASSSTRSITPSSVTRTVTSAVRPSACWVGRTRHASFSWR